MEQEENPNGWHVGAEEGTYGIPEREEGNEPATYNEDEYDEELTNTVEYVFGVAAGKTAFAEHDDAAPKPIRKKTFTATLNSRTDTRKHRKSSNPNRSYKAAITSATSDGMNEDRRGAS